MVSAGLGVFAIDVLLLRHYDAMTNFIHDKTRSIALSLSRVAMHRVHVYGRIYILVVK